MSLNPFIASPEKNVVSVKNKTLKFQLANRCGRKYSVCEGSSSCSPPDEDLLSQAYKNLPVEWRRCQCFPAYRGQNPRLNMKRRSADLISNRLGGVALQLLHKSSTKWRKTKDVKDPARVSCSERRLVSKLGIKGGRKRGIIT